MADDAEEDARRTLELIDCRGGKPPAEHRDAEEDHVEPPPVKAEDRAERHAREQANLLLDHQARVDSLVNVPDLTEGQRSARLHGVCLTYARQVLELTNRQRSET